MTEHRKGSHQIEGIGAGFQPSILDMDYVDEVIPISDDEAILGAKQVMKQYGIFVGISSGAAYAAALRIKEKMKEKNIVVIFADGCEKYMSTRLFED